MRKLWYDSNMSEKFRDPTYLLRNQYKDASNLVARITLHERFSINPESWWEWVWRMMRLPAHARILEVGAGPGMLWVHNLDRIPPGWEVVLSDLSPGMLRQAQANLGQARTRFTWVQCSIMALPFTEASFDGVLAHYMLYHAPDVEGALQELFRVLKPGGRLYAATNGTRHMRQLLALVARWHPEAEFAGMNRAFRLDQSWELMHRYFPVVNTYRFDDGLRITEVEPLIAYILSGLLDIDPLTPHLPEMRAEVQRTIQQKGAFWVEKHSGMFEAIKG